MPVEERGDLDVELKHGDAPETKKPATTPGRKSDAIAGAIGNPEGAARNRLLLRLSYANREALARANTLPRNSGDSRDRGCGVNLGDKTAFLEEAGSYVTMHRFVHRGDGGRRHVDPFSVSRLELC